MTFTNSIYHLSLTDVPKNAFFNECYIFEREQMNCFYVIHMNIFIWGHNIVSISIAVTSI